MKKILTLALQLCVSLVLEKNKEAIHGNAEAPDTITSCAPDTVRLCFRLFVCVFVCVCIYVSCVSETEVIQWKITKNRRHHCVCP